MGEAFVKKRVTMILQFKPTETLRRAIVLLLGLSFGCMSCHKSGAGSSGSGKHVYVAGYMGTQGLTTEGVCWKDGAPVMFPNSTGFTSMSVVDTTVYLLDADGATYWRGGVPQAIPQARFTKSILVSGSDVYVVGATIPSSAGGVGSTAAAIYFRNGAQVDLSQNVPNVVAAFTNGMTISGTDVYVCAYMYTGSNDTNDAVYWKNNTLNYLHNGYEAKAIAVSGTDVYVAGTPIHGGDVYWKNGVMQPLGPDGAIASCILVSGNDVYVGGTTYGQNKAVYWKNGVEVELPGGYSVNAMAIDGSDVYACGNGNGGYAVYWKNGVVDTLGIGGAGAMAVVK
jgi:hypothetical protein